MWTPWGAGMGAEGPQAPWGAQPGAAWARPALSVQVHGRLLGWPRGCQLHPAPALAAGAACQILLGEVGTPCCTGAVPSSGSTRQREAAAARVVVTPGCPAGAGGGCLHPRSEAAALDWELVASGRVLGLAGECQGLGQPRLEVGDAAGGTDPFPLHRSPPRWLQGWRCRGAPHGVCSCPGAGGDPEGCPWEPTASCCLPRAWLPAWHRTTRPLCVPRGAPRCSLPLGVRDPLPTSPLPPQDARSPWQPSHGDRDFTACQPGRKGEERWRGSPPCRR